jgi:hypothetical protein
MSSTINISGGLSFSGIKAAYVNTEQSNAVENSSLRDGSTTSETKISDFREATFDNGTSVPNGTKVIPFGTTFTVTTSGKGGSTTTGKTFDDY